MLDQTVHVLGDDDIVLMLGLLGIEGTVIETGDSFLEKFKILIKDTSIGMIIIGLQLSPADYDFLLNFKFINKFPLIFILPDVFQHDVDKRDVMRNKILEAIGNIIS
ncbi:MAG: V-type ATP synthase subunit F [Promethearchaeota archaeon]|jgi:vacuolar-type H+-ATPase subunit F/Vma7